MLDKFLSKKALEDQIKEGYKYYFINFEGRKVGYVCIRKEDRALFLSKIYIYESYRGMKIGSSTLSFVYEQAKKLNCNIVYLTVNKNNSKSIAVYEKLGFKNVDSLVIDIGKGFVMDDYKMEKILWLGINDLFVGVKKRFKKDHCIIKEIHCAAPCVFIVNWDIFI